jgi:hypothetical protein
VATDAIVLATRVGPLAVTVAQTVTARSAAAAVARCVTLSVPVCAAGAAAAYLYSEYRARKSANGGLEHDVGMPEGDFAGFGYQAAGAGSEIFATPQAAADAAGLALWRGVGNNSGMTYCVVTPFGEGATSSAYRCYSMALGYEDFKSGGLSRIPTTVRRCPDQSVRASGDGLCATGVYAPSTPELLGDHAAGRPFSPQRMVEPLKDAVTGGQQVPAESTGSGPSQLIGPKQVTSTTTGPSGVTKTEQQVVQNYRYDGDTIVVNEGDITTITNPDGSTVVTTNIPPPVKEAVDPCETDPARLGCLKLGEPPTDSVPKLTRDLAWSAESVGLPSGCPAPTAVAGHSVSWQPICDTATGMRPYILAGAAFTALTLLFAGIRQI